jgi:flagellar protein FlaF
MGFSTSVATMLIFMGVVLSIGIMFPAMEGSFEQVSDALEGRDDRVLEQRNSEVNVTNTSYDAAADTFTLEANNTGAVTLDVEEVDVLFDGEIQTGYTASVEGVTGRSLWVSGETLAIEVSSVTSKPTRVKLVTGTGISEMVIL